MVPGESTEHCPNAMDWGLGRGDSMEVLRKEQMSFGSEVLGRILLEQHGTEAPGQFQSFLDIYPS